MLSSPDRKYAPLPLWPCLIASGPTRCWIRPPIWMSTDLRDGNQSLFEPMNGERKMQLFHMLCDMGFKEIEVASAASQIEFDFVRGLIEVRNHIPEDVTIEVLTRTRLAHHPHHGGVAWRPSRHCPCLHRHLRTVPRHGIYHEQGGGQADGPRRRAPDPARSPPPCRRPSGWEDSPATFSATELEFAREICDAVTAEWGPPRRTRHPQSASDGEDEHPTPMPIRSSGRTAIWRAVTVSS